MAEKLASRKVLRDDCRILKRFFRIKEKTPLEYSDKGEWEDPLVVENTNCYRYAFDIPWRDSVQKAMCFLGWSIGHMEHITGEKAFFRFEIDLKRMGFNFEIVDDDKTVPKKGRKIALFVYEHDFHFARQNADGTWSEKDGFGSPVSLFLDDHGNYARPLEYTSSIPFEVRVYNIWI